MTDIYGEWQRALQQAFGVQPLAERVREAIVLPEIPPEHQGFIESRDFFFLSTVDHRGYPTVSHKGGAAGLVKVLDGTTLAFPSLDGNSMYLSMGNIVENSKVGLLFIDFETPHRVRVHGEATASRDDPLMDAGLPAFHGAEMVVRVHVTEIFVNCPRYIHRYRRLASSRYVPRPDCPAPPPQWKRIDALQDALPARDRDIAAQLGGVLTGDEYAALVVKGEA